MSSLGHQMLKTNSYWSKKESTEKRLGMKMSRSRTRATNHSAITAEARDLKVDPNRVVRLWMKSNRPISERSNDVIGHDYERILLYSLTKKIENIFGQKIQFKLQQNWQILAKNG